MTLFAAVVKIWVIVVPKVVKFIKFRIGIISIILKKYCVKYYAYKQWAFINRASTF